MSRRIHSWKAFLYLTALALSAGITSHAQTVSDKKAKRQKEEIVNVRVWLNKGEDKVIDGSDKYVKRLVKMYGALGGPAKVEWVREEYRGKGIDLYSLFTVEAERTGRNITVVKPVRSWYLSIAGDMAIMVGSDTRNSIFDKADPPMSGSMLNKYFGKIYDYPEFAARIGEGEFSTFMDVIHAWESSYGGIALRADGKFKDGQVGVSPVIAEWTKVMKHATDGLRWYFCNKAGPWVEGGHDAGYVSAGLSFKF